MERSHSRSSYPADKMLPSSDVIIDFDPETGEPGPRRRLHGTWHASERRLHRVKTRQRNQRLIREALIDYGDGENC